MDRRRHKSSDLHSRFKSRRGPTAWLYDTNREEFVEDPGIPDEPWPEVVIRAPSCRRRPPRSQVRRLVYWLFANGGLSVVFVFGLMAFALICALVGLR